MKTCTKCGRRKKETSFCFKNKEQGTRQSRCRDCTREDMREQYRKNKSYYVDKAKRVTKRMIEDNREKLLEYLESHPCVDCGEIDPVVLQFDHVNEDKENDVAQLMRQRTWDSVLKEIDKCVIRCANCHARKTAKERKFWKIT